MDSVTSEISVIICAYTAERWGDLVEAIASVQRQTLAPREIIVVVDHNPALLRRTQEQLPHVVALKNALERGLSGARNSGIAAAVGTLLAFLDDDAVASPQWLELLAQALAEPDVLGAGGAVVPHWKFGEPRWFPSEFHWVVGCTYRGMPRISTPIRNPIGANMLVRREVFESVGGFRDGIGRVGSDGRVGKLPFGCEETELCIRARQHWTQRHFLYVPEASVSHRVSPTRATWRYFLARCYAEGRSKAMVSRFVGSQDALSSERGYVASTLPQGIMRGLASTIVGLISCSNGRRRGIGRATMIVVGLTTTILGYVMGHVGA